MSCEVFLGTALLIALCCSIVLLQIILTTNTKSIANRKPFECTKVEISTNDEDVYPENVTLINVRIDLQTGNAVERGRLERLGGISPFVSSEEGKWDEYSKRMPFDEFKRILQCSFSENDLDKRRGIVSFMKLVRVTNQSIQAGCASIESEQICHPLHQCYQLAKQYFYQEIPFSEDFDMNIRLVRVINGKLYYDWPWGTERFRKPTDWSITRLLVGVLEKISDIPDSVFFIRGWDLPLFPGHFPLPAFSHGPTTHHADIPFPWTPIIDDEIDYYTNQLIKGHKIYEDLHPKHDHIWHKRVEKGVFFGALFGDRSGSVARQVVLDLAVLRPDLILAGYTDAFHVHSYSFSSSQTSDLSTYIQSNPHILDTYTNQSMQHPNNHSIHHNQTSSNKFRYRPGELEFSAHLKLKEKVSLSDYMKNYKYLIVLAGSGPSGRLSTFLSHSGAVILLQESEYLYHFSSRLKPWVHYVPISFTAADIISKIEWLRAHDDLARRIAMNGRAFADSFLRLEDYYCYIATALKAFSDVTDPSALQPFNPMPFIVPTGPRAGKLVKYRRRAVRKEKAGNKPNGSEAVREGGKSRSREGKKKKITGNAG